MARSATISVKGKTHKVETLTRPDALALALGISGKQLRGYLRATYAPGSPERDAMQAGGKGSSWTLSAAAIRDAVKKYAA